MKRIAFVLLAACAIVFATAGAAFANFGPHGSYASDTDACAECHRAHTAVSDVTWTDNFEDQRSALLISNATSMTDFCYACHGDGAVGAATNVESGVFAAGTAKTNSSVDATLNGGGFTSIGGIGSSGTGVMSSHGVDGAAGSFVRWGYVKSGTSDLTSMSRFTCTDCHDPHGSSNYRLLKDVINKVTVGGYDASNTPQPWVISNEEGFPQGGFKKGADGAAQVASYTPNYTSAEYAHNEASTRSTSAWCGACHTVYAQNDNEYNYGAKLGGAAGSKVYHRHPIDVPLSVGTGASPEDRALITQLVDDSGMPLEMPFQTFKTTFSYGAAAGTAADKIWDERGYLSCLTCHRAHGTEAKMEGWAATSLTASGVPSVTAGTTNAAEDTHGVNPTFDSALLRYDNRGVCERCHNK